MTEIFSASEKAAARKEKKKLLAIWLTTLFAFVALTVTLVVVDVYLVGELRNRDHTLWMAAVCMLAGVAFGCFTLFFFAIKFRLTAKYVRMLRDIDTGLKDEIDASFVGYDETISMKDGVYFYSMVLEARPLKREDITERKVLVEHTVPPPQLTEGTRLHIVSHANILVAYEVL